MAKRTEFPKTSFRQGVKTILGRDMKKHLPLRDNYSGKKHRLIPYGLTPNALNLLLTTLTQEIKPNAVLLLFNQLIQPIAQLCVLGSCQATFKHAELHPLTIG
jgi:hypothetical protein